MDDIFLKIISGEIPADKVYEDDATLAFLDNQPRNKGHVLVIPKERYRNIFDIPDDVLCRMMQTVRKIAPAIRDAVGADGFNITMNNEPAANQEVFHAHIHIVPRFEGDDSLYTPEPDTRYDESEMKKIAEKIRSKIS